MPGGLRRITSAAFPTLRQQSRALLQCGVLTIGVLGRELHLATPRHRSLVVFPDVPAKDDAAVRRCLDAITEESVLDTARAVLNQPKEEKTTEELLSLPDAVRTPAPYYAARLTAAQLVPAPRR